MANAAPHAANGHPGGIWPPMPITAIHTGSSGAMTVLP